jgi:hypothetical protein
VRTKLLIASAVVVALSMGGWIICAPVLSRVVKQEMISALEQAFASTLEIKNLEVSVFPHVAIVGEGIAFHLKDRPSAPPLFTIRRLTARANVLGLLARHISLVTLEDLDIHVPPRENSAAERARNRETSAKRPPRFVIDEIIADGTALTTLPKDARKEPLHFDIQHLRLYGGGPEDAMKFDAELRNAKPPGEIKSSGRFGPWDRAEPAGTPVSGNYTFRDADLSVFKGIAGMLSSDGSYHGSLGHIEAKGATDVPDFRLVVAGNPSHLTAQYQAVIDGTDGNTYLQPVTGQFGHTSLTAQGSVEAQPGVQGKTVSLDVVVQQGRIEDMLLLAMKGQPIMTGSVHFHAQLVVPPGDIDVTQKVMLNGAMTMDSATFSKLDVQEKVNELSHRGEGKPEESNDENSVASDLKGQFKVNKGVITLNGFSFTVPGVSVDLNGTYGLLNREMDFRGSARLIAKISQTTTGWKSFLLKAVDPIFKRKNVGAEIPLRITGTPDKPSFGL